MFPRVIRRDTVLPEFVYGLRASGTTEIRYVGRTNDPIARFSRHGSGSSFEMRRWLSEIGQRGQVLEMVILAVAAPADATRLEWQLIEMHGATLLNTKRKPGKAA